MDEGAEIPEIKNEQKATSITALKEKHGAMRSLPFIQTRELTGNFDGNPTGQERVLTTTIIAAPNLDSWADEYH